MKNTKFKTKKLLSIMLLSGALLTGSLVNVALYQRITPLLAYDTSSCTTKLDLNDASEETIRNYYKEAEGKNKNSLLISLKEILKTGQKYYSYDKNSGSDIWRIYEIADRDWELSPADKIPSGYGNYDPKTNTIKYYKYGYSVSGDKTNDPYVHALYVNRDKPTVKSAWGSHKRADETCIEREHIWPKSHGFDFKDNEGGARGDVMALWAADGKVNGAHSNLHYGYVDKSKSYTDLGAESEYVNISTFGNYTGKSKTLPSLDRDVFEPQDSDKGDIARACFYMAARYNYLSGSDIDPINSANPNLALGNTVEELSQNNGTSNENTIYYLGIMDDLLEWNRLDPPDEFEIHRNNLLFNNFTKNRNPFIDFPFWAEVIWGNKTSDVASPSSDTINSVDNTPSQSGFKTTICEVSSSFTTSSDISSGAYFLTSVKPDGTEVYLDSNELTKNTKVAGKAFDNTLTTGHFNIEVNDDYSLNILNGDRSKFISAKDDTDIVVSSKSSAYKITSNKNLVHKYGEEDKNLVLLTSLDNLERSLLFKADEFNYFGNFTNAMALNSSYSGLYLHKATYSYDELLRLSSVMSEEDLKNETFYKNYATLYNSLTAKEVEGLKKENVVAKDNNTYNADELIRKAISKYNPETVMPTNEQIIMYVVGLLIILLLVIIVIAIMIKKHNKKKSRKKAKKSSKRK